jgi:hypothetical protein
MPRVSVHLDQERLDVAARLAIAQHRPTRDHLAFLLERAIGAAERAEQRAARPPERGTAAYGPLVRLR